MAILMKNYSRKWYCKNGFKSKYQAHNILVNCTVFIIFMDFAMDRSSTNKNLNDITQFESNSSFVAVAQVSVPLVILP